MNKTCSFLEATCVTWDFEYELDVTVIASLFTALRDKIVKQSKLMGSCGEFQKEKQEEISFRGIRFNNLHLSHKEVLSQSVFTEVNEMRRRVSKRKWSGFERSGAMTS